MTRLGRLQQRAAEKTRPGTGRRVASYNATRYAEAPGLDVAATAWVSGWWLTYPSEKY